MASSESGRNNPGGARPYRKIATEEAFATPELFREYRKILAQLKGHVVISPQLK